MEEVQQTRAIVPGQDYDDRELAQIVTRSEKEGRTINRPSKDAVAKQLRRVVHSLLAGRLIEARNRSGMNNDAINARMHSLYLERRREPKGWAFSNAVAKKSPYLPDEEEIDMLASIIPIDRISATFHLRVLPWAMNDQRSEHEERRRKEEARKMPAQKTAGPPPHEKQVDAQPPRRLPDAQASAGDLKISHNEKGIHVHGKVWCDRHVAQRLRMVVPLKLIQQAHGDNPWCYEMKGQVHDYQLYNLMHVLYGAPRVLQVELN